MRVTCFNSGDEAFTRLLFSRLNRRGVCPVVVFALGPNGELDAMFNGDVPEADMALIAQGVSDALVGIALGST